MPGTLLATASGLSITGGFNTARGTVAMHATTMDLWAQPNTVDGTGSPVAITAIIAAPQAGTIRTLYPPAGTVIVNGAMFSVQGGADYTTSAGDALVFEAVTTGTYKVWLSESAGVSPGQIVQVVEGTPYTAYSSTGEIIPTDDTIPQNVEGVELVTVSITPRSINNLLRVEVSAGVLSGDQIMGITGALFADNNVDALAVGKAAIPTASYMANFYLCHEAVAGTAGLKTFGFRLGAPSAGLVVYINGRFDGRLYGGIAAVRITAMEIQT